MDTFDDAAVNQYLDVIAVGEAVQQVSAEFDLFWNSVSAYPAKSILSRVQPETREALAGRAQAIRDNPETAVFARAIANTEVVKNLMAGSSNTEWTTARVINDDPAKTLNPENLHEVEMLPRLEAAFGRPTTSLDLISPYFVPGDAGTEALSALARRGVHVAVLTNSLAATDVMSVQSGYAKHRKALLQAGVALYELKPEASSIARRAAETGRHSSAGLHAKTYAVDGRAIFVGSFNLDPRSTRLNTGAGDRQSPHGPQAGRGGAEFIALAHLPAFARCRWHHPVARRPGQGLYGRSRNRRAGALCGAHRLLVADRLAALIMGRTSPA